VNINIENHLTLFFKVRGILCQLQISRETWTHLFSISALSERYSIIFEWKYAQKHHEEHKKVVTLSDVFIQVREVTAMIAFVMIPQFTSLFILLLSTTVILCQVWLDERSQNSLTFRSFIHCHVTCFTQISFVDCSCVCQDYSISFRLPWKPKWNVAREKCSEELLPGSV
jgi:hypothetical protein